ncbi:MAG: hypothetical protein AAF664_25895 [Planctomycetota bacterium]
MSTQVQSKTRATRSTSPQFTANSEYALHVEVPKQVESELSEAVCRNAVDPMKCQSFVDRLQK